MLVKLEALKNICGLSLFRDYQDLEEFNVRKYQQRHIGSSGGIPQENEEQVTESAPAVHDPDSRSDPVALIEGPADDS